MKVARVYRDFLIFVCLAGLNLLAEADGQNIPPTVSQEVLVVDSLERPVEGAMVQVADANGKILVRQKTGDSGKVSLPSVGEWPFQILVKLADFKDGFALLDRDTAKTPFEIKLEPLPVQETLTVTATRTEQPLAAVPSSVDLMDQAALQRSPSLTLDDTLRQIPSFSLFRRSSSLVAHPTTQGVSLRGIGPSGVSRTLVLWDGTPMNDPFGGWVYWDQLDKTSLDSIELAPGGGSNLYGSSPLGGVIQVFSRVPEENRLDLDILGGTQGTAGADLLESFLMGPWSGSISGSFLNTEGYYIVPVAFRGPVDDRANSVHYAVRASGYYKPSVRQSAWLNFIQYGEYRDNGTVLQKNQTWITSARAGYRYESSSGRELQVRVTGLLETFRSNFTSISANRQVETLTLNQVVPARSIGSSVQWSGMLKRTHMVTTGVDWLLVRGNSEEVNYFANNPTRFQVAGGNQQLGGVFIQDLYAPSSRWLIQLSARLDGWTNYNAERTVTTFQTGAHTQIPFATQQRGTVIPRAGVSYQLKPTLSLKAAFYQSFRAPTLNELYRGFRVGNVVTNPYDGLGPERLTGFEGNLMWVPKANMSLRVGGYWNQLDNAVSNITIQSLPNLITRQRQNVGEIRVEGAEADFRTYFRQYWMFRTYYLYSDSRVREFPPDPTLVSKYVPQVPPNRVSASAGYSNPRTFELLVNYRYVANQFDDDLNLYPLGSFSVVDLYFSRFIRHNIRFYTSIENLLDRQFLVARTPLENNGAPFMLQLGMRLNF
ncbi:MAG: TonB-dependent receptor [Terriglobia bacterium]